MRKGQLAQNKISDPEKPMLIRKVKRLDKQNRPLKERLRQVEEENRALKAQLEEYIKVKRYRRSYAPRFSIPPDIFYSLTTRH